MSGKYNRIVNGQIVWLTAEEEAALEAQWAAAAAEANTPKVPVSITPRQCRLLLLQQGLLSTVEAMIAQQDDATKITWEYALEFRRDDPLLTQLATNLGLTSQQIDEFFIAASTL